MTQWYFLHKNQDILLVKTSMNLYIKQYIVLVLGHHRCIVKNFLSNNSD